jgi:hypothetical protein
VSNTEVELSPLVAEIGDGTVQISVRTAVEATLKAATLDSGSISSATPYIVLRWSYVAQANNYVEVHAIASVAAAQANDIIVGKCTFSGATLTGFDYTDRTPLNVQNVFLRVEATEDTEMYEWVRGGRVQNVTQYITVPEQKVGPFTVPLSYSRIDLVYVDNNGVPQIQQGVAAPSPVAPGYVGKLVLAQVRVVNGDTNIAASRITDVRSFLVAPAIPDDSSLELNSNGKLAIKSALGASIYDSGWFSCTTGGTYTKSHGLSSQNLLTQVLFKDTGNQFGLGANRVYAVSYYRSEANDEGACVTNITTTQLTIQAGQNKVALTFNTSGVRQYATSGQYKVLALKMA